MAATRPLRIEKEILIPDALCSILTNVKRREREAILYMARRSQVAAAAGGGGVSCCCTVVPRGEDCFLAIHLVGPRELRAFFSLQKHIFSRNRCQTKSYFRPKT